MKHVKLFEQFINKSVNEGSKSEELSEFNKTLDEKTADGWKMLKKNKGPNEKVASFEFYHNTQPVTADQIKKDGWQLKENTKGALYGKGIYFTKDEPNTRWGDASIKVKVKPKNVLYDPEGDMRYEGTALGDAILKYSGLKNEPENPEKWREGLYKFLAEKGYDSVLTKEYDKTILVVFDPKIIENDKTESSNVKSIVKRKRNSISLRK